MPAERVFLVETFGDLMLCGSLGFSAPFATQELKRKNPMDEFSISETAAEVADVAAQSSVSQLSSSLLLVLTIAAGWFFISIIVLRRSSFAAAERRRWRSAVRGIAVLSLVVGLLYVWAPELRTFALSIVAFAVALVIATKELILCLLGGIYRLVTGASKIGDVVRVGDLRGEIVDQTLLAITLQEMGSAETAGSFTGNRIVIPNSMLLTTPVRNETEVSEFGIRELVVPVEREADIPARKLQLLTAAETQLAPINEQSAEFKKRLGAVVDTRARSLEPKVRLKVNEDGEPRLVLTCYAPPAVWPGMQDKILSDFLRASGSGSV